MGILMKILIWIGCVVVYSVVVTALKFGGVSLGALPVALLFLLLVLLPAPALCRVIDKKRSAGGESGKPWPCLLYTSRSVFPDAHAAGENTSQLDPRLRARILAN